MKFLICLCVLLILSGCSYSAFEDSLRGNLNEAQDRIEEMITPDSDENKQETEIVNGVEVNVDKPEKEKNEDIIFKSVGESFSGYELYKYSSTITEDIGTKGLVYTLNSVRVYDSFYEAELGDTAHLCDNPVELENNRFILLDMKAEYTAPSEDKTEVIASVTDLEAKNIIGVKRNDNNEERLKNMSPYVAYFSHAVTESGGELDPNHQKFSYIIKDGETFEFKIGIIAGKEFVDNKDVYLSVNYVPKEGTEYIDGYKYKYFILFPEAE